MRILRFIFNAALTIAILSCIDSGYALAGKKPNTAEGAVKASTEAKQTNTKPENGSEPKQPQKEATHADKNGEPNTPEASSLPANESYGHEKDKTDEATSVSGHDQATPFDLSKGFSSIAENVVKAVVNVSTTQVIDGNDREQRFPVSPFDQLFQEFMERFDRPRRVQALGSGFIIKCEASTIYIVTNYHVVAEAKKIVVTLHDGVELKATIHAVDDRTDVAVLKVNTEQLPADKRKLPCLEWGDSNLAKVGDWVLAIGNPFGLGSTVTEGIISNRARSIAGRARGGGNESINYVDDFIQHTASINLGNSGGPIVNLQGQVIGVNTAIVSPSGGNVGIGFAVPANLAQDTVRQLLDFGRTRRGWLGVKIQNVTPDIAENLGLKDSHGVIVGSVTPEGPAAKAKIEPGDVILKFDGKEINERSRLTRIVGETPVGKSVEVKIWRNGKEIETKVTLGEYESEVKHDKSIDKVKRTPSGAVEVLGLKVSLLTPEARERYGINKDAKGILIVEVKSNSLASEQFIPGDVISTVNYKQITTPDEFLAAIEEAKKAGRKGVLLFVTRAGEPRFLSLKITSSTDEEDEDGSSGKAEKIVPKGVPKDKKVQ